MVLIGLVLAHQLLTGFKDRVIWGVGSYLLLAYVAWQVFKSYHSIAPVVSLQQLSRTIWFPIFLWSFGYFIRTRRQFELMLWVVIGAAILTYAYAYLIAIPSVYQALFSYGPEGPKTLVVLDDWPLVGWALKNFFYTKDTLPLIGGQLGGSFKLSAYSFFSGKQDAGTFGNKNFLAAYINIVSALFIYKAWFCLKNPKLFVKLGGGLLGLIAIGSYAYLVELENRGSWLGFAGGAATMGLFMMFCILRGGRGGFRSFH